MCSYLYLYSICIHPRRKLRCLPSARPISSLLPVKSLYPHLTGGHQKRIPARYIFKNLAVSDANAAENVIAFKNVDNTNDVVDKTLDNTDPQLNPLQMAGPAQERVEEREVLYLRLRPEGRQRLCQPLSLRACGKKFRQTTSNPKLCRTQQCTNRCTTWCNIIP